MISVVVTRKGHPVADGPGEPLQDQLHALGYRLTVISATPDRSTLDAECLDDHPALVDFHEGIRRGLSLESVGALRDADIREIEETFVKYREGQG